MKVTEEAKKGAVSQAAAALNVFGVEVTMLAGAAETGGGCSVAWVVCPPGAGAPPHRHLQTERFHVLRGRLTVRTGAERLLLEPGEALEIGPWAVHSFANEDPGQEVEFIGIGTPAGHENFFRDADELARSGRFNPQTAAELCQRYDIELVEVTPEGPI